jgi:hypothetical protein
MKEIFKFLLIGCCVCLGHLQGFAQNKGQLYANELDLVREFLLKNLKADVRDTSMMKYSSYVIELVIGDSVHINYPFEVSTAIAQRKTGLELKLKEFLIENKLDFNSTTLFVFPVIQVWKDQQKRIDNLEEVLEKIYGNGLIYVNSSSKLRLESPILIKVFEREV